MSKTKNQYERQAIKNGILGSITRDLDTKGDAKNSAIETAKDVVVGVVGGGLAGAALGKFSLLAGAVITGIGHYTKSRLASIFGVGMMATGGLVQSEAGMKGMEDKDMLEGAKERVLAFKDSFPKRIFLDKLLSSKKAGQNENEAMGEVQYFVYPGREQDGGMSGSLDLTALEHIENQIAESGADYASRSDMKGLLGEESEVGSLDPSDRNF